MNEFVHQFQKNKKERITCEVQMDSKNLFLSAYFCLCRSENRYEFQRLGLKTGVEMAFVGLK